VNTIKHYGNTVCALTGFDVLVYVKLSWHLKQCHISIKNVIVERMTVVINMHKHVSCHDYKGVMSVLCTPLVLCYQHVFKASIHHS